MIKNNQEQEIINSLKFITKVFKNCDSDYRIIGSIILVAYKHNIFRHINDVDILLDEESHDRVFEKIKLAGFVFKKRRWGGFNWIEAYKKNYLGLTFFLIGKFTPEYFSYRFLKICELRINNDYIKSTRYEFGGITFTGVPITSAIAGIYQAFLNPKRSTDKQLLSEEIKTLPIKKYGNINVYIAGIKIPYLFDVFSFFYNLYGGLRVILGQRYESWE